MDLSFTGPVEPYPPYTPPSRCEAGERPGVRSFAAWVLEHVGGDDWGIARACPADGIATSAHHEGRAWDWHPPDRATADALIDCLLASEGDEQHAVLRRAGIHNVIYYERIWSASRGGWAPYRHGPASSDTMAHRDHVHFEFSPAGATASTSFYRAIGAAPEPEQRQGPHHSLGAAQQTVPAVRTPMSPDVLRAVLAEAHRAELGAQPSAHRLRIAWAMVQHETGNTASMWNWNAGNIACTRGWPVCHALKVRDPEREPVRYRSYDSAEHGARDWWRLMAGRYATALEYFDSGDIDGAALALKERGYYGQAHYLYADALDRHAVRYDKLFGAPSSAPSPLSALLVLGFTGGALLGLSSV